MAKETNRTNDTDEVKDYDQQQCPAASPFESDACYNRLLFRQPSAWIVVRQRFPPE